MTELALRPRYRYNSNLSITEIRSEIKTALKDEGQNSFDLLQKVVGHHVVISFPVKHSHFWSPILDMNMETNQDSQTRLRVLMAPAPAVWTLFMFLYTLGGLAVLAGMVLGYSQWVLGHGLALLWLIPAGLVLILFLYIAGITGKHKAHDQMRILKGFMEEALAGHISLEETNIE